MAKRKYPSELNTRTVRVNIGDWQWLNSLAQNLDITVAQAFHKVITGQDHNQEPKAPIQRAQMPMPVFQVTGKPIVPIIPTTAIAINGSKAAAFKIKPKGARYD